MRFVGDIALDAEVRAIASGAITDGAPVVVNADGTVGETVSTLTQSIGSSLEFESGTAYLCKVVFDTNTNRIVIVYAKNTSGSGYGTAVVGTVSSSSISFGTPVVFESADCSDIDATFHLASNKIVIAYKDNDNSLYGTAIVGTVDSSDNSISFGSAAVFESANTSNISCASDLNDASTGKVLIAYVDQDNSNYGTSVMASVSGTSISFSSKVIFESASTVKISTAYSTHHSKWAIAYTDVGNSQYGTAIIASINSGVPQYSGSAAVFESATTSTKSVAWVRDTAQSGNVQNLAISYRDDGNSSHGTVAVGTVSGSTISFQTPAVFAAASTGASDFNGPSSIFDTSLDKLIIAYRDGGDSNKLSVIAGKMSGTTITFDTEATSSFSTVSNVGIGFDSNINKAVIAYKYTTASHTGAASIFQAGGSLEKLTSENFIGFANAAYADGQKATVKTTGSIARNVVAAVAQSASSGSIVEFEAAIARTSLNRSIAYDTNSDKVVIVYYDGGNSNYGTAIVGTLSGTSISFGSAAVFESASTALGASVAFDNNSNKFLIVYQDAGNSSYGTAIVGTVSGTSISFGSATVFKSAAIKGATVAFDSNSNKFLVTYESGTTGQARVGTISSTSVSFGTQVLFETSDGGDGITNLDSTFDSGNNKIIVTYQHAGTASHGKAVVATISGTDVSFGTKATFNSASTTFTAIDYIGSSKVLIAYKDSGNSHYGTAIVGTISGTDISFGSEFIFNSANSGDRITVSYDSSRDKSFIAYSDVGNSEYVAISGATVSGTNITFDTKAVLNSVASVSVTAMYIPDGNYIVVWYSDNADSGHGKAIVYSPSSEPVTLTIGQQYFVQTDGSLGTSADDPSVIAGTAIGTSDIIVKG